MYKIVRTTYAHMYKHWYIFTTTADAPGGLKPGHGEALEGRAEREHKHRVAVPDQQREYMVCGYVVRVTREESKLDVARNVRSQ